MTAAALLAAISRPVDLATAQWASLLPAPSWGNDIVTNPPWTMGGASSSGSTAGTPVARRAGQTGTRPVWGYQSGGGMVRFHTVEGLTASALVGLGGWLYTSVGTTIAIRSPEQASGNKTVVTEAGWNFVWFAEASAGTSLLVQISTETGKTGLGSAPAVVIGVDDFVCAVLP